MSTPIVFIFQGSKLPKYIIHSLKLNRKLSPDLEIYFVSNLRLNERVLGINEVAIDSFYRSSFNSYFSSEKKNKWWDGFWNKTLERFFVLEVFMQEYDFQSVIHMEVDNIGFDLAKTAGIISEFGQGMYYPTYPEKTSAASILFVNGTSSIAHFNSFIKKNNNKNDMQLLYEYRTSADSTAKDLPIDINAKNLEELGIFDLNFLGHYLFGLDKRILKRLNTNLTITNRELYYTLINSKLKFTFEENILYIILEGGKVKINNVHVHSKIHRKLVHPSYFEYLILSANYEKKVILEFNLYHIICNNFISLLIYVRNLLRKLKQHF